MRSSSCVSICGRILFNHYGRIYRGPMVSSITRRGSRVLAPQALCPTRSFSRYIRRSQDYAPVLYEERKGSLTVRRRTRSSRTFQAPLLLIENRCTTPSSSTLLCDILNGMQRRSDCIKSLRGQDMIFLKRNSRGSRELVSISRWLNKVPHSRKLKPGIENLPSP